MPGGERAIHEPWRMALAHLVDSGGTTWPIRAQRLPAELAVVRRMIERHINTPLTSSAGRLFDAVAALAGVRSVARYEGQAAVELEWLAAETPQDGVYPYELGSRSDPEAPLVVDTRPLIRAIAEDAATGVRAALIARRFHSTLVDLISSVCARLSEETGIGAVVLSGGVFLNALLVSEVCSRLVRDGFRTYRHRLVPPNDGGLCLGQLAVAAASGH